MKSHKDQREPGDWASGHLEQLRRWAAMPLRDQLLALEEMAELAERLQKAPVLKARALGRAVQAEPPADDD